MGLANGTITPRAQDSSQATRAPLLKKEHGQIDWNLGAREIFNRIRGFEPWPGAYTWFRGQHCQVWGNVWRRMEGKMLHNQIDDGHGLSPARPDTNPGAISQEGERVVVACGGETFLTLEAVKLEGRGRVSARDFVNGARLMPREAFSSIPLPSAN
jgi:methionyl-tRNA formyltransferase